jgi:hypothetical protein
MEMDHDVLYSTTAPSSTLPDQREEEGQESLLHRRQQRQIVGANAHSQLRTQALEHYYDVLDT